MLTLQFLAPNLAVQLHNFGYSPLNIGFAFGIPAILYATTCPFIYLLTDRFKKRGLILIGFICLTFAMLMIGGTDAIEIFYKNPFFIFLGLCIMGLSTSLCTIPCLPEMLDAIEEDPSFDNRYDEEELENVISGLFVTVQSLGEAIGPMVSSLLVDNYGFRNA
jgi:MFS family permease